jgi:hypothetical protein
MKVFRYRLTVFCSRGQVDKRYSQIISSHIHTLTPPTGGDCHRKGEGGFSGLNSKSDTDGQQHPTISIQQSGFPNIFFSDWMRWNISERAYPVVFYWALQTLIYRRRLDETHKKTPQDVYPWSKTQNKCAIISEHLLLLGKKVQKVANMCDM